MQTDNGQLNRIRTQEEYDAILAEQKEALLQKALPFEGILGEGPE